MLLMHVLNDEHVELCEHGLQAFTALVKKVGLEPAEATLRECLQSRSWHVRRGSLRLILAGLCSDGCDGGDDSESSRLSATALVTEAARLMKDPSTHVCSAVQQLLAKSTLCGIFVGEADQRQLVAHSKLNEVQRPQTSSGQLGSQLVNGDCLDSGCGGHGSHVRWATAPVTSASKQYSDVQLNQPWTLCTLVSSNISSKYKISNVDNTSIQSEPSIQSSSTCPSFSSSMDPNDSPRTSTSDPVPDQSKLSMLKRKTLVRVRQAAAQHPHNEKLNKEAASLVGSKSPLILSNGVVHCTQGLKDNRAILCPPAAKMSSSTGSIDGECSETGVSGDAELMTPRSASPTSFTPVANVDKCENGQMVEQRTWAAIPGHNVTPPRPNNNIPTVAQAAKTTVINRTDAMDYLNFEDINPSSNPKMELSEVLRGLDKQTWPGIFHQLTSVRRLALHHGHMLEPHVHTIILGVTNQAANLRSQVSKNALLCLGDMWKGMGRVLDPELQVVTPVIIKKSADKVEFIREAAELAVKDIIAGGSDSRVIAAFLMCMGPGTPGLKSSPLRAKIAAALRMCLAEKGQQLAVTAPKEVKRIVNALGSLLQDSSQETREHSKQIASLLAEAGIMNEHALRKALPESAFSRIKVLLQATSARSEKYNHPASLISTSPPRIVRGNGLLGTGNTTTRDDCSRRERNSRTVGTTVNGVIDSSFGERNGGRSLSLQHNVANGGLRSVPTTGFQSPPSIRINGTEHCNLPPPSSLSPQLPKMEKLEHNIKSSTTNLRSVDIDTLPSLLLRMEGENWRDRQTAVGELSKLFVAQPEAFVDPTRLGKCMNHIHDRLHDTNTKVCLAAVKVFPLISNSLGNALDPFVSFLVPTICNLLGSTSGQLIKEAERALEALSKAVGPSRLLPLVTTKSLSGNTRLRGPLLVVLSALVTAAGLEEIDNPSQSSRLTLITRYALPVACRNVREAKPEVRTANRKLIDALRGVIGPDVDVQIKTELSSPKKSKNRCNKSSISPLGITT